MGRKNNFDDGFLKYLLSFYDEGRYSKEIEARVNSLVDLHLKNKKEAAGAKNLAIKCLFSPIPAFSVLLIIIAVSICLAFLFGGTGLKSAIVMKKISGDKIESRVLKGNSELKTFEHETIYIKTDRVTLVLKESGSLVIKNNNPLFKKSGSDIYYLENGTIDASVEHNEKRGNFRIDTPYGSISDIGTEFQVSVLKNNFIVSCSKGAVEITSRFLPGNKIIKAGETVNMEINRPVEKSADSPNKARQEGENSKIKKSPILPDKNKPSGKVENSSAGENSNSDEERSFLENEKSGNMNMPSLVWSKKLAGKEFQKIIDFGGYIGIQSDDSVIIIDEANGSIIRNFRLPEKASNFYSYKDMLCFFVPPADYFIYKIPEFKIICNVALGPVEKGNPVIDESRLAVASTDGKLYIYDYKAKSLKAKNDFNSPLDCTPLLFDDYAVVTSRLKTVMLYSISSGSMVWEHAVKNQFKPDRPVLDNSERFFAIVDEKNTGYEFNVFNGNVANYFYNDENIPPVFAGNNLLVSSDSALRLYGRYGRQILKTRKFSGLKGFFRYKNSVYLAGDRNIMMFYKMKLYDLIDFNGSYLFLFSKDKLYIEDNNYVLYDYQLQGSMPLRNF